MKLIRLESVGSFFDPSAMTVYPAHLHDGAPILICGIPLDDASESWFATLERDDMALVDAARFLASACEDVPAVSMEGEKIKKEEK